VDIQEVIKEGHRLRFQGIRWQDGTQPFSLAHQLLDAGDRWLLPGERSAQRGGHLKAVGLSRQVAQAPRHLPNPLSRNFSLNLPGITDLSRPRSLSTASSSATGNTSDGGGAGGAGGCSVSFLRSDLDGRYQISSLTSLSKGRGGGESVNGRDACRPKPGGGDMWYTTGSSLAPLPSPSVSLRASQPAVV